MSDSIVLDTDVVSYLLDNDPAADWYRPHLEGKTLVVSFMTVAEMELGAMLANWGEKRLQRLRDHLARFVVHPYTRELSLSWATVMTVSQRAGLEMGTSDAWVAAVAHMHGLPLATNNYRHFRCAPLVELISAAMPARSGDSRS